MKRNLYFFNRLSTAIVACVMLLSTAGVNAQDLSDGLILHYDFANTGTIDATGNGYDASLYDGAEISNVDEMNVLDLTETDVAYLQIDTANGFETAMAGLIDYTISTKVKLNSRSGWARLWDFGTGTANSMFLTMSQGSANGTLFYNIYGTSGDARISATDPVPTDKWVTVVLSVSESVGTLYIDGAEVGSAENLAIGPYSLGAANFKNSYIGKSQWSDPYMDGYVSDFRIYDRGISTTEVFMLSGIPLELLDARDAITSLLGDLSEVTSNLTLPVESNGVKIDWTSNKPEAIDSTGVVTQPEKYAVTVNLSATLSFNGDTLKQEYIATVKPQTETGILVARWTFNDDAITAVSNDSITISDDSENSFLGTLKNEASIKQIGETENFNVLDLGNGTGYFDMGTDIGEAIYSLSDYTIGAYFRIHEDYTEVGSNGNFLWSLSNTDNIDRDVNGYMGIRMLDQRVSITPTIFGGDQQTVNPGQAAEQGKWCHVAYVQSGTTGSVYINGELAASSTVTNIPATTLVKEGRIGTLFNWLGRSCYASDVYLRQTMIYDFRLYNVASTDDDVPFVFGDPDKGYYDVNEVIEALDIAYEENSNNVPAQLVAELENLELGDLSAITSDITLPSAGTLDESISILWSSSNSSVLTSEGTVTRKEYLDRKVVLTAKLMLGAQYLTKEFTVTVKALEGTTYTSDVLINYNFQSDLVNDSIVTDASEKAFTGTLKNGAEVKMLSDGFVNYQVLNLPNDSAYFDMGTEVGKVAYGLDETYSVSVYFLIDENKANFSSNGNFVWTFSNSDSSDIYRNGYMYARPVSNTISVTSGYWSEGNQSINYPDFSPAQGTWHNMVFVQNDTLGVVYLNGDTLSVGKLTNYPYLTLPKDSLEGTMYNFLGRPNFSNDAYLGKAMIYDFKVYDKSLDYSEIEDMQNVRDGLEIAYFMSLSTDEKTVTDITIVSIENGVIEVTGKADSDIVEVYDITGRQVTATTENKINTKPGLYIVKIGNMAQKVFVK